MSGRDGGVLDTHCSGPLGQTPGGQAVTADEVAPL